MARWTAAGSLAHGVRRVPQSRSQLRVSVGLAPTSPVPGPRPGNRTQHPGCAQPLSRGHVSRRDDHDANPARRLPTRPAASGTATTAPPTWHAGVWLVWALAAAACIQLAPSPVYVALVIGIASARGLHARTTRARTPARSRCCWRSASLFARDPHAAHRRAPRTACGDVLFTTPRLHAPAAARRVHRRRDRRAAGRAAVAGRGLRHRRHDGGVRRVQRGGVALRARAVHPAAFYEVGLVVVVALAFVPSTLAAIARRPRGRPRPHRRPGRAARPPAAPDRAGARARAWNARSRSRSRWTRGFAHAGADPRDRDRRVVRRRRRCSRSAARSSPSSGESTHGGGGARARPAPVGLGVAVLLASSGTQRIRYRPRRMTRRRLAHRRRRRSLAPIAMAVVLGRRRQQPRLGRQPAALARARTSLPRPARAARRCSLPVARCRPTRWPAR